MNDTLLLENTAFIMNELSFPADACEVLLSALKTILSDEESRLKLYEILEEYNKTEKCNYSDMLQDIKALGEKHQIHEYTVSLLLFLCIGEKLRLRYMERGIDEAIFWNSMADLRYKLEECRLVYGIVGSFVARWFIGFFELTRFSLGRLQFEITTLRRDVEIDGITLSKGTKALNIHIPRSGTRLLPEMVADAYKQASVFYRSEFEGRPLVFHCESWMLYPWNMTVLSPSSNMASFFNDFTIIESGEYDNYKEVWRLFDHLYTGDPDELPQDTSLRRAYVKRMKAGEKTGWGEGVFIYR